MGGKPEAYWIAALRDNNPDVRCKAVEALGLMCLINTDSVHTLSKLVSALDDKNDYVAFAAYLAVASLGTKAGPAIPSLCARLGIGRYSRRGSPY